MPTGYYNDGTIKVTNGSADVTGVSTAFLNFVREGDKLNLDGLVVPIETVNLDSGAVALTLAYVWPGTTHTAGSGVPYWIETIPDLSRAVDLLAEVRALLGDGNIEAFGALSGLANKVPYFTGAGTLALSDLPANARTFLADAAAASNQVTNLGLALAVGASQMAVNLKQADGATDPTATNPVIVGFRNATLTSGAFNQRSVTGALALTVSSGAALGQADGVAANLYLYAIDNAGTVELAISGADYGGSGRVSTTVMNASADSSSPMYSTTARSNVPFVKIATLVSTQTTAGNWAAVPSTVSLPAFGAAESEYFKTLKAAADASSFRSLSNALSRDEPYMLPQGRISLTSGVAVPEGAVAGATTVYYVPSGGQWVPVYDGTRFVNRSMGSQISLALDSNAGHTGFHASGIVYDAFGYWDGSALKIVTNYWEAGAVGGSSNYGSGARGTGAGSSELEVYQGLLVNKNSMTARFGTSSGDTVTVAARQGTYLGSFMCTAAGQASDTAAKRLLFNAYNQAERILSLGAPANHNWSTASYQALNADATTNHLEVLFGLSGSEISVEAINTVGNSGTTHRAVNNGIGLNSTSANSALSSWTSVSTANSQVASSALSIYRGNPGIGPHKFNWLEQGAGSDTQTWYQTLSGMRARAMI